MRYLHMLGQEVVDAGNRIITTPNNESETRLVFHVMCTDGADMELTPFRLRLEFTRAEKVCRGQDILGITCA